MKKILAKVLAEIKPENQRIAEVEDFLRRINSEIKKLKISAKAAAGGSYAKNTWLKGDYDIDIFVKFAMKFKGKDISHALGRILKKFRPQKIHGSRDYYWVKNSIKFEIIPVLDIKKPSDAENVTDFSPQHVSWVNKAGKKYKDDIRLAKRFCKANKCYGAESYIRGFSGHVMDILVIYYKGFAPLLRAATKWKPKVIVDYYNKVGKNAEMILNKSKIQGPLIIIDPVQPDRNSAAALCNEMFDIFVKSAKNFLKKPSIELFSYRETDFERLKKKGALYAAEVAVPEGKEDPVGTRLVKAFKHIALKLNDFIVLDKGWIWDKGRKAIFWYLLKNSMRTADFEWRGPPIAMKEEALRFKKKHRKTYVKKNILYTKVKYKYTTAKDVLEKELFNDNYVNERVDRCRLKKV